MRCVCRFLFAATCRWSFIIAQERAADTARSGIQIPAGKVTGSRTLSDYNNQKVLIGTNGALAVSTDDARQAEAFVTAQAQQEASAHGWIVVLERGAPVSCDGNRCVQLIQSGAGADTLYFEESVTLAAVGSVVGCSTFRCDGRVGRASQTLADHNYVDGTAVNLRLQLRLMLRGGMDGGVSDTGGTEAYRSLTGPATAGAAVAVEQGEDVSHWKKLGALIEALRAARHTSEPTRASARNEPGAPAPSASPSANVLRFGLKSMGGPGISVATRAPGDGSAHGKLLGLLHEFAAAFLPSTKYSTIQINFDTKYGIHTDEVCSVAVDVQKSDYRS